MSQVIRFEFGAQLVWRYLRSPSGNWVAVCDPLGLTIEGENWEELYQNIGNGLGLLFEDLVKTGELSTFLRNQGWKPTTPIPTRNRGLRFDLPWTLQPDRNAAAREAVRTY